MLGPSSRDAVAKDVEALMHQIETERIAREELERLDGWLDSLDAAPLTDHEMALCMQRIYAWIDATPTEEGS